jgi:hypothetical protein
MLASRWFTDVAFAAPPQSGLAWSCFQLPNRPGEFHPSPPEVRARPSGNKAIADSTRISSLFSLPASQRSMCWRKNSRRRHRPP